MLVVALLSVTVHASEQMYSGWILSGESVELENREYIVMNAQDTDELIVRGDLGITTVKNGSCNTLVLYEICFLNYRFDLAAGHGAIDYARDKLLYENQITINDISPHIKIHHVENPPKIAKRETSKITVQINNTGEHSAYNLTYRVRLPPTLRVVEKDNLVKVEDGYVTRTYPIVDSDHSFWYVVTMDLETNATWKTNVTFLYRNEKMSVESDEGKVTYGKPLRPLVVTALFQPDRIAPYERTRFNVTLKNTHNFSTINLTEFSITFDPELEPRLTSHSPLNERQKRVYNLTDLMARGKKVELSGTAWSEYTNGHFMNVKYEYSFFDPVEGREFYIKENISAVANVTFNPLEPQIILTPDVNLFETNEDFSISFSLENDNEFIKHYKNIHYEISAAFLNHTGAFVPDISFLQADGRIIFYKEELAAPWVDEKTVFPINFTGTYYTEANEKFSFSEQTQITVEPPDTSQSLAFFYKVPEVAARNNRFLVEVMIRNIESYTFKNIYVESNTPGFVIDGKSNETVNVPPVSKVTVLKYDVLIPPDSQDKVINITTRAVYDVDGIQRKLLRTVSVPIVNWTEVFFSNESLENTSLEINADANVTVNPFPRREKEKGIWEKIVDFFKNLF